MKGKPQTLVPNYTVQEAVNMLPYLKSYCRDLKRANDRTKKYVRIARRLTTMIAIGPERERKIDILLETLKYKLDCMQKRIVEWYQELDKMHIVICSVEMGAVDIPVYVEDIDNVIYLCVTPDTLPDTIEWHSLDEGCENSRVFKWIPIETG